MLLDLPLDCKLALLALSSPRHLGGQPSSGRSEASNLGFTRSQAGVGVRDTRIGISQTAVSPPSVGARKGRLRSAGSLPSSLTARPESRCSSRARNRTNRTQSHAQSSTAEPLQFDRLGRDLDLRRSRSLPVWDDHPLPSLTLLRDGEQEPEVLWTLTAGRELHRLGLGPSRGESVRTGSRLVASRPYDAVAPLLVSLSTVSPLSFTLELEER